tara:strand:+ start:1 stop:864 length:864 start_codon:yes stop_codon:yes gene_type:complete
MKEDGIIKEANNFIKKTELKKNEKLNKSENKTINSELDFNDFIEIQQNYETSKKNEIPVINKINIIPIKNDKKILSVSHSTFKSKKIEEKKNIFNFKPLEKKIQKNRVIRNTSLHKQKEVITIGKSIFEKKNKFDISFKWPIKKNMHNLIYKKMLKCLNAKTVLLGDNQVFYSQKGILDKIKIRNNYSPILRLPNYSSAKLENNILNNIKKKYPQAAKGKLIRLFDKNVDAYILGYFKLLAKSKFLNFKKISGVYSIFHNKLFLINLSVDDLKIDGKIDLSNLNKGC